MYNLLVWTMTQEARKALDAGDNDSAKFYAWLAYSEAATLAQFVPDMAQEQKDEVVALAKETGVIA